MNSRMDTYNYWNDERVQAGMMNDPYRVIKSDDAQTVVELSEALYGFLIDEGILPEGHEGVFTLATNYEVCGICNGAGTMVNPSIDAGGLTQADFSDDPDFEEAYFDGRYDTTCAGCNGRRVVPNIEFPEKGEEAINTGRDNEADCVAESAAERAMGA